jgi:hypothetical protein
MLQKLWFHVLKLIRIEAQGRDSPSIPLHFSLLAEFLLEKLQSKTKIEEFQIW